MGRIPRKKQLFARYILHCERCQAKVPRYRKPARKVSCGRCGPRHYDDRFRLTVVEAVPRQAAERIAS